MDKLQSFYEQYSLLKDKLKENFNDFSADLLQYGITEKYKCRHGEKTSFRGQVSLSEDKRFSLWIFNMGIN